MRPPRRRRPPTPERLLRRGFTRATGIPTTRRGVRRRAFRMARRQARSGCLLPVIGALAALLLLIGGILLP